ncbi:MAG: hypothetical protein ACJAZ0_003033, partial [Halioglobus sp.]
MRTVLKLLVIPATVLITACTVNPYTG